MSDTPERIIQDREARKRRAQELEAAEQRAATLRLIYLTAPKAHARLERTGYAEPNPISLKLQYGEIVTWRLAQAVVDLHGTWRHFYLYHGSKAGFVVQKTDASDFPGVISMMSLDSYVRNTSDLENILNALCKLAGLPHNDFSPRREIKLTWSERFECFLGGI